jgi:hypothetical protein
MTELHLGGKISRGGGRTCPPPPGTTLREIRRVLWRAQKDPEPPPIAALAYLRNVPRGSREKVRAAIRGHVADQSVLKQATTHPPTFNRKAPELVFS